MKNIIDDEQARELTQELKDMVYKEAHAFDGIMKDVAITYNPFRTTIRMVFKAPCGTIMQPKAGTMEYEEVPRKYFAQFTIENTQIIEYNQSTEFELLSTAIADRIYLELTEQAKDLDTPQLAEADRDEIANFLKSRFPNLQTIAELKA